MLLLFAPHIFKASMQAITLGVCALFGLFLRVDVKKETIRLIRFLLIIGAIMYFFVGGTDFDELERIIAEQEAAAAVA